MNFRAVVVAMASLLALCAASLPTSPYDLKTISDAGMRMWSPSGYSFQSRDASITFAPGGPIYCSGGSCFVNSALPKCGQSQGTVSFDGGNSCSPVVTSLSGQASNPVVLSGPTSAGAMTVFYSGEDCPKDGVWRWNVAGDAWECVENTVTPVMVVASGDAGYVWDDLRVPLASLSRPAVTAPDWVKLMDNTGTGGTSTGIYVWSYRATQEDDLVFIAQMPHGWAPGTDVEAHLHWTMATTTIGMNDAGSLASVWGLECAIAGINENFRVSDEATARSHSGYTATLNVGAGHKFNVGQNIVVSSVTEAGSCTGGSYNGNFVIKAITDTEISYVTLVTCTETSTAQGANTVYGYTIKREVGGSVATNSQWKHLMTDFGSYKMGNCNTVSCIWSCRLYRPTSAIDIQESIPALEVDFHFAKGRIGSSTELTY